MGNAKRAPTDAELDAMRAIVREGRDAGAVGFSTGPHLRAGPLTPTRTR